MFLTLHGDWSDRINVYMQTPLEPHKQAQSKDKKKQKTMTHIKSLKYTRMDWQTTAKVQSEHKQRLVKQVQTSAQYLREDECIYFLPLHGPGSLHQSD